MRRDVFQAIADPTRRDIINLLARQPLNLNGVAENFNTSRPAISKHIKILTECGLVVIRQEGRERHCEVRMNKLDEISSWVEQCRLFWAEKLDNLERFLASQKALAAAPVASKITSVASKESVPVKAGVPAKAAAASKSSAPKKTPSVRRTAPPKSKKQ